MASIAGGTADHRCQNADRREVPFDLAHAGVILAGEDTPTGLNLGYSGQICRVLVCPRSAGGDDSAAVARLLREVAGLEQLGDCRRDRCPFLGRIGDHERMTFVSHQSIESQTRAGGNLPAKRQSVLRGWNACSLHAKVDIDENTNRDAGIVRRPAKFSHMLGVVNVTFTSAC